MNVKCSYCNQEFDKKIGEVNRSKTGRHFCCRGHYDLYREASNPTSYKCAECGDEFEKSPTLRDKRENHFCGRDCYATWRHKNLTRENNPNWQGGSTNSLRYKIRNSWEGQKWRKAIIERDEYQCQHCGEAEHLDIHHIKEFADIMKENNIQSMEEGIQCEELWNINNGITLCVHCHAEEHPNKKHLILRRVS